MPNRMGHVREEECKYPSPLLRPMMGLRWGFSNISTTTDKDEGKGDHMEEMNSRDNYGRTTRLVGWR